MSLQILLPNELHSSYTSIRKKTSQTQTQGQQYSYPQNKVISYAHCITSTVWAWYKKLTLLLKATYKMHSKIFFSTCTISATAYCFASKTQRKSADLTAFLCLLWRRQLINPLSTTALLFGSELPWRTMLHIQQLAANCLIPLLVGFFTCSIYKWNEVHQGLSSQIFIHPPLGFTEASCLTLSRQKTKTELKELTKKPRAFLRFLDPSTCDKLSQLQPKSQTPEGKVGADL